MPSKEFKITVTVRGVVQGVGFRYYVMRHAGKAFVKGFVKNLYNGDVYLEAEGSEENLKELIAAVKKGPYGSHVIDAVTEWHESKNEFNNFEIRH
ncbi:MAG: acylphosphatase [Ignavibacteriaceae bacterium]|nr:acylphosphatase [Ignavibacteriaceae bacterium]